MADIGLPENIEPPPRILIMGLRKSGKSSIHKVVFHKMAPGDTLFLESTTSIFHDDVSSGSFIHFQIWDCPGQEDYTDPDKFDLDLMFGQKGAIIFVIDAQDDYNEALTILNKVFKTAYAINPTLKFEIFVHKIDVVPEDQKYELHKYINDRATEELKIEEIHNINLSIYLTSIYDHSIFDAFSKVVQKLIKNLPELEKMLNMFSTNSGIRKVYLFDVVTKIYIATDNTQIENELYELCCDMFDVTFDIATIYSEGEEDPETTSYDTELSSLIKLSPDYVLYLLGVNKHLAVVSIILESNFQKRATIDYNFDILKQKINQLIEANKQNNQRPPNPSPPGIQPK